MGRGKDYQLSAQSHAGYVIGGEEKARPFARCQSVEMHSVSAAFHSHHPVLWGGGGVIGFSVGAKDMDIKLH